MIYASHLHSPRQRELEYLAGWQRARAELDNFRRRQATEMQNNSMRAHREILALLLPLADNFQAIGAHLPDDLKENAWAVGVLHVSRQLESFLGEQGITPINNIDEPFDPKKHEAIKAVKQPPASAGQIVEIVQIGYVWQGEVIRPAKVKIAA